MSEPTGEADALQFECPLCGGGFEVSAEWLGQEVECPHCGGAVALAAEEPPPARPPNEPPDAAPDVEPAQSPLASIVELESRRREAAFRETVELPPLEREPAGVSGIESPRLDDPPPAPPPPAPAPPLVEKPPLTPEERAALRQRVNAILAVAGVIVLVGSFILLSWLAQ